MDLDAGLMCFAGPQAGGEAGSLLLRVGLEPSLTLGLFAWDVVALPGTAYMADAFTDLDDMSGFEPAGAMLKRVEADSCRGEAMVQAYEGSLSEGSLGLLPCTRSCHPEYQASSPSTLHPHSTVSAKRAADSTESAEDSVILVASVHCGSSLRSAKTDPACHVVIVKVACTTNSRVSTLPESSDSAEGGGCRSGAPGPLLQQTADLAVPPGVLHGGDLTGDPGTRISTHNRMSVLWQRTRALPKRYDHANMMCLDEAQTRLPPLA